MTRCLIEKVAKVSIREQFEFLRAKAPLEETR